VKISFTRDGWEDYTSWANERTILKRINRMIEEAARDPATGIGKPERLSHNLSGYWSRRITDEHRLVYQLRDEELVIVQARYLYRAKTRCRHVTRYFSDRARQLAGTR
jgi:toxin YoeB